MAGKIVCYYALGGLNYKNGFVTSCPQQSDQLHLMDQHILPSEIINSKGFVEHRKELMSGTWSAGCHLCEEVERDSAGKSMRMDYPADESHYDPQSGTISFNGLKHVEVRFSNSCNMACLHCSDVYSSGWMSKLKNYQPDEEDRKYKLLQLTKTMHRKNLDDDLTIGVSIEESERIAEDLNNNFPNIEKVEFSGGEVLYQKQFFPFLKKIAKHPNAKNITISFHTNFNAKFKPEELSKLLEPFGKSNIQISLDAGENIYSYFRTGDWNVLVDNLNRFRNVNNFSHLSVVCTTSAYQIMDIENIFASFLKLDIECIDSSIVYTPRYINPAIMMLKFKEQVLEDIQKTYKMIDDELTRRMTDFARYKRLRSWEDHRKEFRDIRTARKSLQAIEDYVRNTKAEEEHWEAFKIYIRKSDALWSHNFNDFMVKYKFVDGDIIRSQS
jgi:MoaA/NifB/PqqE/SkfB family radical SAM enzyme